MARLAMVCLVAGSSWGVAQGGCTDADMANINAAGPGHSHKSFPAICARCGTHSFSIWSGFDENGYKRCVEGAVHVSPGCARCSLGAALYGYHNCKAACLLSWCGQDCLQCQTAYQSKLEECVGHELPGATPCTTLNSTANQTEILV